MKQSIKMVLTLVFIAVLSGLILAKVFEITKPKIEAKQKELTQEAIFTVLPKTKNYKKERYDDFEVFRCFDKNQNVCGFAFVAEGIGYQDTIKIMIGLNADLSKIQGIKILEDSETPGLGARINEESFQYQFKDILTNSGIKVVKEKPKDKNEIQAITGATISSLAVVDIINERIDKIKEAICPKQ